MPANDPLPAVLVELLPRLGVDLGALVALLGLLLLRRTGSRDVVSACAAFNVGLFSVAQVISSADLGVGAGFGLFAVLSIIRLRSDVFGNAQLAYVFSVLAIALVTGIPGVPVPTGALLAALVVLTVALADAGRRSRTSTTEVLLDAVHADRSTLVASVERQLGLQVRHLEVLEVDLVRETTRVQVSARPAPVARTRESLPGGQR